MFRALLFLGLLVIVSGLAVWLADNPGDVSMRWQGYRIDTTFGVMVGVVALVAATVAVLYRMWLILRRAPEQIGRYRREHKRQRGYMALSSGMVAVAAGDAEEANRHARRAEVLLDDPPLNMLLSAQAAQLSGDDQAAARFFESMLDNPETEFLGLRGLLNQAMARDAWDEALGLARRAYRLRPRSGWVAGQLLDLQVRNGQWADAQLTLEQARRVGAVAADSVDRRGAVLAHLRGLEAQAAGDDPEALRQVRRAHEVDPGFVPAAVRLARLHIARNKPKRALAAVQKAWERNPHPDLIALYRDIKAPNDAIAWVKTLKELTAVRPDHPEGLVALARAELEANLWGESRRHLKEAGDDDPPARVCRLLAELEEREHGDLDRARVWLVRASAADPDPAWCCEACGNAVAQWVPTCAKCASFDSHVWRTPAHVVGVTGPVPVAAMTGPTETAPSSAAAAPPTAETVGA